MQCCATVRANYAATLNGGDRTGVWILSFSEDTLFEYIVSTILSSIVGLFSRKVNCKEISKFDQNHGVTHIRHFHFSHNAPYFPPKFCISNVFNFSWDWCDTVAGKCNPWLHFIPLSSWRQVLKHIHPRVWKGRGRVFQGGGGGQFA